jgi:beta-glucanase (GH16 family)
MLRKSLSALLAALLALSLFGVTSASAATTPRITKAASIPLVIASGALAVVTPAVTNLKATRTYVWYINGARTTPSTFRSFRTFKEDRGLSLFAVEYLKFANKTVLKSRTNTVEIGAGELYLWSQEFNEAAGTAPSSREFDLGSDYAAGDGSLIGNPGWGNNERQWYTPSQARTDGAGNLVLTAKKTVAGDNLNCYYGTCTWKSAKLVTLGKVGFKYGRLEIRAKVSGGRGQWPAIWMLGANQPVVGWPQCGEIDIAEMKGDLPNMLWGTLHGPNYLNRGNTTAIPGGFTGYHVYRIDWVANRIIWYIDGVKYHEMRNTYIDGNEWVFNTEQYLILNVAMGGNFVGNNISSSLTSTSMSVDYIRFSKINGVGALIRH